jgi:hypothetical protein
MSELKRTNSEFRNPRPEKSVWAPSARAQQTVEILLPSNLDLEPAMELLDSYLRFDNDPYNSVGRRTRTGRSA